MTRVKGMLPPYRCRTDTMLHSTLQPANTQLPGSDAVNPGAND